MTLPSWGPAKLKDYLLIVKLSKQPSYRDRTQQTLKWLRISFWSIDQPLWVWLVWLKRQSHPWCADSKVPGHMGLRARQRDYRIHEEEAPVGLPEFIPSCHFVPPQTEHSHLMTVWKYRAHTDHHGTSSCAQTDPRAFTLWWTGPAWVSSGFCPAGPP